MARSFIEVKFGGNVSKAVERTFGSRTITVISFATEGQKKKDSEDRWPTKWWDAETTENVKINKGDYVTGEGMMSYDEKDGKRFYKVKFAKNIAVTPKGEGNKPTTANVHGQTITDEDLPF